MEKYVILVLFIITILTISGYLLYKNKDRLSDFHKKISGVALLTMIFIYSKMIIQNWEYLNIQRKLSVANVIFLALGGITLFYSKIVEEENRNKFDNFINKFGIFLVVLPLGCIYILKKILG